MPKIAEIEPTPNPNAIKFVLKEPLTLGVSRNFATADAAADDELACALFAIPHVTNVYYLERWLTVTQDGQADWSELVRQVAEPIRAAKASEAPEAGARPALELPAEDLARVARIEEILDAKIRPALMADGGGLEIVGLEGMVLSIRYHGACGSCPSSLYGTLYAIENLVQTVEPGLTVAIV